MFKNAPSDIIHIQRSISIQAPPEKIFALIHDFRCWQSWSPWEKLDPHMDRSFSGSTCGQGAVYAWTGKAGNGHMEIISSIPTTQIHIQLEITKPFDAQNNVEFSLQTSDDMTVLTWSMSGPKPYLAKLIGIFFSMDKYLGKDLEKGLQNLKTLAEAHTSPIMLK